MRILSKADIEEADDITEKEVPIPEWGEDAGVVVKSITHRAMRDIRKNLAVDEDEDVDEAELEKWIVIKGMVQPECDEVFYETLLDKSTGAVTKILQGILGTTKVGEAAVKEAEKSDAAESGRVLSVPPSGIPGHDRGASTHREAAAT